MATKTISITEEAYNILKSKKEDLESFSEVITRLSGKRKLSSFFGVLSKKSALGLEKDIRRLREEHRELHKKRLKRFKI